MKIQKSTVRKMKEDKRIPIYIVLIVLLIILITTGIFPIDSYLIFIIPGLLILLIFEFLFHGCKPSESANKQDEKISV